MRFVLLVLIVCVCGSARADEFVSMGHVGSYHGDEVSFVDGEAVLVLRRDESGRITLVQDRVSVLMEHDGIIDETDQDKTGKVVSLGSGVSEDVVVILHEDLGLKAGGVQEANKAEECQEFQLDDCALLFGGQDIGIEIVGRSPPGDVDMPDGGDRYLYDLRIEGVVLKGVSDIIWAGDLDRDGRMDLLVDTRNHYNVGFRYELYLSSYGDDDELGMAAKFYTFGC